MFLVLQKWSYSLHICGLFHLLAAFFFRCQRNFRKEKTSKKKQKITKLNKIKWEKFIQSRMRDGKTFVQKFVTTTINAIVVWFFDSCRRCKPSIPIIWWWAYCFSNAYILRIIMHIAFTVQFAIKTCNTLNEFYFVINCSFNNHNLIIHEIIFKMI